MCNCINESLERVNGKILEQLPERAINDSFESDYDGRVWRFSGNVDNNVMMKINYSYQMKKVNGELMKNKSKSSISLAMSYCPMCGEKFEEKAKGNG